MRKRNTVFPDFSSAVTELQRFKDSLGQVAGNLAYQMTMRNFEVEAFLGRKPARWPARKLDDKRRGQRALLVKSGRLRRSIRVVPRYMAFSLSSDVPYAQVHNEGYSGMVGVPAHTRKQRVFQKGKHRKLTKHKVEVNVKGHQRKMVIPKRQFMGFSDLYYERLDNYIEQSLTKIFSSI